MRRSGNTVRITAQLINAVTGFHLWSHTYDRDLTDVLKLQSEIAGAVASALKVRLLADTVTKIEVGGTRNPAAFDAYLRASPNARWRNCALRKGRAARSHTRGSTHNGVIAAAHWITLKPPCAVGIPGYSL